MILYHYPTCSTCRKARKWLDENGHEHTLVHLVDETPDRDTLADLWAASGLPLKKFFNTSGRVYRENDMKTALAYMGDDEKLSVLAAEGMLIKLSLIHI